jgi:hypothetical protein
VDESDTFNVLAVLDPESLRRPRGGEVAVWFVEHERRRQRGRIGRSIDGTTIPVHNLSRHE